MTTLPREPQVFRFGALSRLRPYIDAPEKLPVLDVLNIWQLGPQDVIVSPRPRSTIMEALFFSRPISQRPAIVQVSDGYIFKLNAHKKCNQRYGWLNRYIIGDHLMIVQPLESIEEICEEPDLVTSMIEYEILENTLEITHPQIVIVAGNDPFFDFNPDECIAAFADAYRQLRAYFGDAADISLSATNRKLTGPLLEKCPDLREIGRISDAGLSQDRCIFVGSPSTVLHEQFLAGRPCFLLPVYAGSGIDRFCHDLSILLKSKISASGEVRVTYRTLQNLRRTSKCNRVDLLEFSGKKRAPAFRPRRLLRTLQPLVLANELRLLLLGYRERKE